MLVFHENEYKSIPKDQFKLICNIFRQGFVTPCSTAQYGMTISWLPGKEQWLPSIEIWNVLFPAVILWFGKVVQVGNLIFTSCVLRFGKVLQVGDLTLARIVLRFGPVVQVSNLGFTGIVLRVQFAVKFGDVSDACLKKTTIKLRNQNLNNAWYLSGSSTYFYQIYVQ